MEKLIGIARHKACHKKGQRGYEDHHKGYFKVYGEHKDKCAHDGAKACEKLGKPHEQAVGYLLHIGYHTADKISVRVRVDIGKGQLFKLCKGFVSKVTDNVEGDLVGTNGHEPLAKCGERHGHKENDNNRDKLIKVHIALADDNVHTLTYKDRSV